MRMCMYMSQHQHFGLCLAYRFLKPCIHLRMHVCLHVCMCTYKMPCPYMCTYIAGTDMCMPGAHLQYSTDISVSTGCVSPYLHRRSRPICIDYARAASRHNYITNCLPYRFSHLSPSSISSAVGDELPLPLPLLCIFTSRAGRTLRGDCHDRPRSDEVSLS